jgi:hypothetical protein
VYVDALLAAGFEYE